jgi:hypothetical protein
LARQQAATPGWVVSGVRHVALDLDAAARFLLQQTDGRHDRAALAAAMQAHLAAAGIRLTREQLATPIDQQLWQWLRQGVCVAA